MEVIDKTGTQNLQAGDIVRNTESVQYGVICHDGRPFVQYITKDSRGRLGFDFVEDVPLVKINATKITFE